MKIEESIKPLKILMSKYKQIDEMNNFDHELALVIDYTELSTIETLLTAYEKEKEKNKELEDTLKCTQNSWYEDTKVIEKQSKEIEELKQIKCKLDEKNIPIETLLAEFERLEDLEDDLTTVYLNGVYDGEKKVEDKIKAKIEELENEHTGCTHNVFSVLQSLLEKE